MSRIRSGFTHQALLIPKPPLHLESHEFLLGLRTNLEALLHEMYESDPVIVIGDSWADMEEEYKDCESVLDAIRFLQNNGFSHSALSDAFNQIYLKDSSWTEKMTLDCLRVDQSKSDMTTWSLEWEESTADQAEFAVQLVQEMFKTTRAKFPYFRGQIVYGSIDAPGTGSLEDRHTYVCISTVNTHGCADIRCIDVERAGWLSPKAFSVNKDLLLEIYDDGLKEFKVEFEHWCLALGAKSKINYSDHDPFVHLQILPTDFETAMMLNRSANDRLISKFMSWVQNWRVMEHYPSTILDHELADVDGNPSEQVSKLVSF